MNAAKDNRERSFPEVKNQEASEKSARSTFTQSKAYSWAGSAGLH